MNLVFLTHPPFLNSLSMPRFAAMLTNGMAMRGHTIEVWTAQPKFFKLPLPASFKKWLGYTDQYILFPREVKRKIKNCPPDTLFVLTDHALGMWVPLVADRPHVIHCHDFLAQRSALGEIPQNPTQWSGRQYQALICRGYREGKHFISSSKKTQEDLHRFLGTPRHSEMVYNGLNQTFLKIDPAEARQFVGTKIGLDLSAGYLLHVGGNQWYKNRRGVIEIYESWREMSALKLPLLMIGPPPSKALFDRHAASKFKDNIHLLSGMDDEFVRSAYAGATVFLFPSLAEGFGWPIAEAMASGVPVVTTDEAPMSEVAGQAGFLIPARPFNDEEASRWALSAGKVIEKITQFNSTERQQAIQAGLGNSKRFDTKVALDRIEEIYQKIVKQHS